jgi:hypothetical protein
MVDYMDRSVVLSLSCDDISIMLSEKFGLSIELVEQLYG